MLSHRFHPAVGMTRTKALVVVVTLRLVTWPASLLQTQMHHHHHHHHHYCSPVCRSFSFDLFLLSSSTLALIEVIPFGLERTEGTVAGAMTSGLRALMRMSETEWEAHTLAVLICPATPSRLFTIVIPVE